MYFTVVVAFFVNGEKYGHNEWRSKGEIVVMSFQTDDGRGREWERKRKQILFFELSLVVIRYLRCFHNFFDLILKLIHHLPCSFFIFFFFFSFSLSHILVRSDYVAYYGIEVFASCTRSAGQFLLNITTGHSAVFQLAEGTKVYDHRPTCNPVVYIYKLGILLGFVRKVLSLNSSDFWILKKQEEIHTFVASACKRVF